jgi:hypothetical protein
VVKEKELRGGEGEVKGLKDAVCKKCVRCELYYGDGRCDPIYLDLSVEAVDNCKRFKEIEEK